MSLEALREQWEEKPSRVLAISLSVVLTLLAVVWFWPSAPSSEGEALIREHLETLVLAVEERDIQATAPFLAEDFVGNMGMGKAQTLTYGRAWLQRYSNIGVTWTIEDITMYDTRATVRIQTLLTGSSIVPGMGLRGRVMYVDIGWRLEDDGQWRMVTLNWSDQRSS